MGDGNGHAQHRLDVVEQDQRDLRQLFLDEMRALRLDLKHVAEVVKLNSITADTILAELRLRDADE